MSIIQTRNYILKWVNSSVTLSVLFNILPKWHVIKTKHTCRFGESGIGRTSLHASMFVIESFVCVAQNKKVDLLGKTRLVTNGNHSVMPLCNFFYSPKLNVGISMTLCVRC
jgi:hypothetical protein